jgi:hypothetical protein
MSNGLKDGPLPARYEPLESPVDSPVYQSQQINPAAIEACGDPASRSLQETRSGWVTRAGAPSRGPRRGMFRL